MPIRSIQRASLATLAGLIPHYACFYTFQTPLLTGAIAEWIMARTPSRLAVALLIFLGPWAKPFALTGALASLGFVFLVAQVPIRRREISVPLLVAAAAVLMCALLPYRSLLGNVSFWIPGLGSLALLLHRPGSAVLSRSRRLFLASTMPAGAAVVALEGYLRDASLARRAVQPVALFAYSPPDPPFARGLVRRAVTPVAEFYGMSKNAVDPAPDPSGWQLLITAHGRTLRQFSFAELLSLPRIERYATLRCVSNTLQSDLMGTALWSAIFLHQLVDRRFIPSDTIEVAFLGADGHADSLTLDYAFSSEPLLALGMNGKTLIRVHGFPIRLLAPRYYGFKNVKWLSEIRFVNRPFFGTWPKLGYTNEPLIHTTSHIDHIAAGNGRLRVGGVSFAGIRGIRQVEVRTGSGLWTPAVLEPPLSPFTWTRWQAALPDDGAPIAQARALDGLGRWQEPAPGPLFPDGVTGPTIRSIPR